MAAYASPRDLHIVKSPFLTSKGFSNVTYTLKPQKLKVEELGKPEKGTFEVPRRSSAFTKTATAQKIATSYEAQRHIEDARTPAEIRLWQTIERARLAVIDRCDDARVEEMKLTKVLKKRLYKPASSRTSSALKSRVPVEITRSPLKPRRAKSAYNKIINSYS